MSKPDKHQWYEYVRYKIQQGKGECIVDADVATHQSSDGSNVRMKVLVWKPPTPIDGEINPLAMLGLPPPTGEERRELMAVLEQGSLYWAVKCEPACSQSNSWHPLAGVMDEREDSELLAEVGSVVVDNAVTRTMLGHLAKTDEEWLSHAGSDGADCWRGRLIRCISILWE